MWALLQGVEQGVRLPDLPTRGRWKCRAENRARAVGQKGAGNQVPGCCYDPGEDGGSLDQDRAGRSGRILDTLRSWSQRTECNCGTHPELSHLCLSVRSSRRAPTLLPACTLLLRLAVLGPDLSSGCPLRWQSLPGAHSLSRSAFLPTNSPPVLSRGETSPP